MPDPFSNADAFESRWWRSAIDLSICFVIAVILLRGFVLEGYLISTGSMAPGLLGYHRRITCPSCQYEFAFGVAFDDSASDSGAGRIQELDDSRRYATCPNCGQINIDVKDVPNSHGDQLLVLKHVYDLRQPRRWETIVFRNPAAPEEAFVKRVVGLPGERLRILDGEVYINGAIARKDFAEQTAMRIPIFDLQHLSSKSDWVLPWELDQGWDADEGALRCRTSPETASPETASPETASPETAFSADAQGESLSNTRPVSRSLKESDATEQEPQWIHFRNWRWLGGDHISETPLSAAEGQSDWAGFVRRSDAVPLTWTCRVDYDSQREILSCRGVMPEGLQQDLLKQAASESFQRAVCRLAALSHLAPVTDRYGYNTIVSSPEFVVNDLMMEARVSWSDPPRIVCMRLPVEAESFEVRVTPHAALVQLVSLESGAVLGQGRYEKVSAPGDSEKLQETLLLEVSNFDQQIVVAINGLPCFNAVRIDPNVSPPKPPPGGITLGNTAKITAERTAGLATRFEQQKRWALGVSGGDVRVSELRMFRDVYYTPGKRRHAVDAEFTVPDGSYFVQGDNSPVSSDSRNWTNPCVPDKLLIGKPFLLHLPSRPAVLQFARREWSVRIPDWSRIRYIQ